MLQSVQGRNRGSLQNGSCVEGGVGWDGMGDWPLGVKLLPLRQVNPKFKTDLEDFPVT